MNRPIKILIAGFGCLLGFIIASHPEISPVDWLNPILQVVGFLFVICGGLYSLLKLARPLIY